EIVIGRGRNKAKRDAPPDVAKAQSDLDTRRLKLEKEIEKLKAVPLEDPLKNVMNVIGEVSPVVEEGQKLLNDKDVGGLATAGAVLQDLQTLYAAYAAQLAAVNQVISKLRDLKIQIKKALLTRLKVEEDILLGRMALYERREKELEPIRRLMSEFKQPADVAPSEAIEITLANLAPNRSKVQHAVRSL